MKIDKTEEGLSYLSFFDIHTLFTLLIPPNVFNFV